MNLKALNVSIRTLSKVVKKSAPTILSIAGAGGVVATGIAAAKAGYKDARQDVCVETYHPWETKEEKVKRKIRTYAKPVIFGAASVGCILAGDRIHARRYAALGAAASIIQNRYDSLQHYLSGCKGYSVEQDGTRNEYTDKGETLKRAMAEVNMANARAVHDRLEKLGIKPYDTHTGNDLWYEPITMIYFLASEKHVDDAEYSFNRNFILKGHCQFSEWLRFLGLPESRDPEHKMLHWDSYEGETIYGYQWIDFRHIQSTLPDGTEYTQLFYPFDPHLSEK